MKKNGRPLAARFLSRLRQTSEDDLILDRAFGIRRHDLARDEIIPILELALGARFHDRLGARFANLRQLVEIGRRRSVEIDLLSLRRGRWRDGLRGRRRWRGHGRFGGRCRLRRLRESGAGKDRRESCAAEKLAKDHGGYPYSSSGYLLLARAGAHRAGCDGIRPVAHQDSNHALASKRRQQGTAAAFR